MHASGIFTAGLIAGGSFGVIFALAAIGVQQLIHNHRCRKKNEKAEHFRQVARAAIAAHKGHHEKRAAA